MKDNRPVNLDMGTIVPALPITAFISILHRVSGTFLVAGMALLLWMLDASLASEDSFARIGELLQSGPFKLALWLVLAALIYHTIAGVKHLIMDIGIGESMEGGRLGSRITLALSIVLILLVGVWLW